MKKSRWVTSGVITAALFVLGACGNNSAATEEKGTEIKIGTGNDALPFAYLNENGELDGYDVAILKAIDEKLPEYTFVLEGADFSTTLSNLESKKVDIAAYEYEINDERQEKFIYGDVGYSVWDTYIIFDPANGSTYNTFDDLAGKKIYVTTATNQAVMAENYLSEHPDAFELVYGEYNNEQIVQALTSGVVDATLSPQYQLDNWNNSFNTSLERGNEPVHNSNAFLFFNKKTDEKLIEAVNTGLQELIDDGTVKKLSEQYLKGDYVPK
jgi:L-cystine transport system substrate-binding protein